MEKIETKRLRMVPMTQDELLVLVNQYKNEAPELSLAYQEMLDNCMKYPKQYVWYTAWKIGLLGTETEVGYAGFKGFHAGTPEIGYGIEDKYAGRGYATEAVKGLCNWALQMPGIIEIEAETDFDNVRSSKVLIKNGFVKTAIVGEEGPRYILKA